MILAAFGSIKGHMSLLREVVDAIDREGIQTVLCTGNGAVGPQPNEVIDAIRQRRIHVVQGESDRQLAQFARKRKRLGRELDETGLLQLERAYRACHSANIEWLAGLPHCRTFTVDGEPIALFNGSIPSAAISLAESDPDQNFRRQREIVPARVFVCGGSEPAFVRYVDGALFVNPGAVQPPGSEQAHYFVISTESGEPLAEKVSFRGTSGA